LVWTIALSLGPALADADAASDKAAVASAFANMKRTADEFHCGALGDGAKLIMKLRQSGLSPTEVIEQAMPLDGLDVRAAVKEAFNAPRAVSKSDKAIATEEFRNEYEAACVNLIAP
jgi:hypothetical protein